MQRFWHKVTDTFGNPVAGAAATVYLTGTSTLATIYQPSGADTPTSVQSNPVVTDATGIVQFAIPDGDYDIVVSGSSITSYTLWRWNAFDGSTATTGSQSSFSLTGFAEIGTTGSPGVSITLTKQNVTANQILAGPATGVPAAWAARALVANDINPAGVDNANNQTGLAGNKTWTGVHTFSSTVTHSGAVTNSSTVANNGNVSQAASTYNIWDKTSKSSIASAGSYGWKTALAQLQTATGYATSPITSTALTGTTIYPYTFGHGSTPSIGGFLLLPLDYAEGTNIYPFVTWSPVGTNTNVVRWGLEYTFAKGFNQATVPASTTIYVEPSASTGAAGRIYTTEFAALTGTNMEGDTVLAFRLFRDGSHINDTDTDSAVLLSLGVHYQTSRPFGSINHSNPLYT